MPTKDWTAECPPYDSQYSAKGHTDAQDCVEESLCHITYMLTGIRYSPRALAYLTPVQPTGSSVTQALAAEKVFGFIPYDLWPTPDTFTWETYYADIPQTVLDQAQFYVIKLLPPDLNVSPLWTELEFGSNLPIPTRHMVAQINQTQYFDSEAGNPIKNISDPSPLGSNAIIAYQTSISLTPITMSQIGTQNYKGELRITLKASTEAQWQVLCAVYGIDPTAAPDEVV